jgi:pyocin large subunit-like protein
MMKNKFRAILALLLAVFVSTFTGCVFTPAEVSNTTTASFAVITDSPTTVSESSTSADSSKTVVSSDVSSDSTTVATTEKTTKATTEQTTEATTEKTTVATTEKTTKATTEKTTKATTEKITVATTEKTTKATTEKTTVATTEKTTEATTTVETTTTKRDVFSSGTQFRNKDRFEEHYQKHVINQAEFGDITKEEYLALAQDLVDTPGSQVLTKNNDDGDTLFYDPDTNSFAVVSGDGYLRTFFKPSAGQKYFDKQ